MAVTVLVVCFFALIVLGVPIAVALGISAIVTAFFFDPMNPAILGQKVFANVDHVTLMAVPFFFFAASFMECGGLVARLIGLAKSLVGHVRGGLGVATVLACTFFAAISGSSPATVAAIGKIMYPNLVKEGYSKSYSLGLLVTAGSVGILIPPSIPLILYGFVTETSIPELFIAGIIPGLIYGGLMMVMAWFLARKKGSNLTERIDWAGRRSALRTAGPALLLPLFIVIGIYGFPKFEMAGIEYQGGAIFTPTEAAVMACVLALIIGRIVFKELGAGTVCRAITDTAPRVGMIFWITINALLFGFVLTRLGIPAALSDAILALDMPLWAFLLLVNLALVIVGFFLEGVPTILMFIPLLFPAAQAMGIDPVHFGIIVVVNIELGLVTPPVGMNLFVGSGISDMPVITVFRAALRWMIVPVVTLILVTFIPQLSLFLPRLMFF